MEDTLRCLKTIIFTTVSSLDILSNKEVRFYLTRNKSYKCHSQPLEYTAHYTGENQEKKDQTSPVITVRSMAIDD